ncbi:MAG: polysaccharide biosynthesis protein, partial [Aureliella sp.]
EGDFHAYCFDALGSEFPAFAKQALSQGKPYDYVLNFSALKHVRSEKDPFTLMRLIDVNIFLTRKLLEFAQRGGAKKFFCVSTDKAANPVNMMGGSKRIMEMFLLGDESSTAVSTARFANVAFSDGSLPHAWTQRMLKRQPLAAPNDIRRYFVTGQEGAQLCLFSILLGQDREIFFPKLSPRLHLITFSSMAERYLQSLGYEPYQCSSEEEARSRVDELSANRQWPCYFFKTDTTGEKDFEEFYTDSEQVDWDRFSEIGVVLNEAVAPPEQLQAFTQCIEALRGNQAWTKQDLLEAFGELLPNFAHKETGKNLDNRM